MDVLQGQEDSICYHFDHLIYFNDSIVSVVENLAENPLNVWHNH